MASIVALHPVQPAAAMAVAVTALPAVTVPIAVRPSSRSAVLTGVAVPVRPAAMTAVARPMLRFAARPVVALPIFRSAALKSVARPGPAVVTAAPNAAEAFRA